MKTKKKGVVFVALVPRLSGLLESAAEHLAEFEASRADDPSNEDAGNQFAYGLATGIYSSVVSIMVAPEAGAFLSFSQWVELGCPTDPRVLVKAQ